MQKIGSLRSINPYNPFLGMGITLARALLLACSTLSVGCSAAHASKRVQGDVPVANVETMDDIIDRNVVDRRQQMILLGAFAGLALVLASIGLYGVLSYAVTQRSREIGLRMALGASGSSVVRMIVRHGLALTGIGIAIGLAGSWAATRSLKNLLYGVSATDPVTFAEVAALLMLIALAACWIPARRASKLDPIKVLREE